MNSNKGFSLIELLVTVGIIGILTAIALPMYRDYVLRVRMTETINAVTVLARDAQISIEEGGPIRPADLEEVAKRAGLSVWDIGCSGSFYAVGLEVPKDKLNYIGITVPYIRAIHLVGHTDRPCSSNSSIFDNGMDITLELDTDALGTPNGTGYDSIVISASKEVIYIDLDGKEIRREIGSVLSCAISSGGPPPYLQFGVPISALPSVCRYYNVLYATPKTLMELSGY